MKSNSIIIEIKKNIQFYADHKLYYVYVLCNKSMIQIIKSLANNFSDGFMQCVGDCRGAYQNRPVVCMANEDNLLEVTREQECDSERRPHSKQKCRLSECDREASAWFVNDWSLVRIYDSGFKLYRYSIQLVITHDTRDTV